MERVVKELQAAGATVVDVAIPDYDAKYARGARQRARVAEGGVDGVPVARRAGPATRC